ncbi:hypothetical protein CVT24_002585 [Panaeolus cyanescens]|uniref:Uncharacterized protein n=1 Tax=Panaeolus cyanescens TaxID=181874 RepID=A0A409YY59_9AGAR|nr:hypothetical protein CVT24_002585 [Panaeolus cyanescens]
MSDTEKRKTAGAVMEIVDCLPQLSEPIELLPNESRPGNRLQERFPFQVILDKTLPPPPGPPPDGEEWPTRHNFQSVASTLVYRATSEDGEPPTLRRVWESWARVGRATSVDTELAGICVALCKALALPGCTVVYLFSDCLPALRLATDCTEHSGQQHSLAIVRALAGWLPESANHRVYLIHSPSRLKWGPQGEAHELLQARPWVAVGCHARTTLSWLRDFADRKALDLWNARFSHQLLNPVPPPLAVGKSSSSHCTTPTAPQGGLGSDCARSEVKLPSITSSTSRFPPASSPVDQSPCSASPYPTSQSKRDVVRSNPRPQHPTARSEGEGPSATSEGEMSVTSAPAATPSSHSSALILPMVLQLRNTKQGVRDNMAVATAAITQMISWFKGHQVSDSTTEAPIVVTSLVQLLQKLHDSK